jgi:PAS domain S-box-containing protein
MTPLDAELAKRVFVLAPLGRDGPVIREILRSGGFNGVLCSNVRALRGKLGEACTAVVAEEAFSREADFAAMQEWLSAQPPWSDFPFVFLSLAADETDERRTALRDMLGNITLLERPLRPDTLLRAVRAASRARQRQLEAAQLLQERARVEAELREIEEHYRHAAELNPQVAWTARPDGQLDRVAERWREWTGTSGLGDTWGLGLHEEDLAFTIAAWRKSVATGQHYDVEHRVRMQAGGYRWARSRAYPRRDEFGRIVKWYGSTEDIHDQKRAEAGLREANETLEARVAERTAELVEAQAALAQAQKMEAVGQLTGGVAHDFNNLLMVVSGGLDMLGRHQDSERRQRIMDGMRQAVERGAALTRQLLTFSRRQALKPEPMALEQRIGDMRELLDRSLRGDITVEMQFAPDLWPINVDPTQLELAVLNLAVNARDAMPNGGMLTIRAQNVPTSPGNEVQEDFVSLSVSDTGTGMDAAVLARAFEPFFTTKDVGKGSGLGLAQIYGFAKQSGGVVRIESEVGVGTTVVLLLPRSRHPVVSERRLALPNNVGREAGAPRSATVLLVEDDNEVAALVADMIEQLGYEVTRVANAAAALGALANGRIIDIVFSDILMPGGMSGAELAKEIARRRPNLPIVLTTGYDGQSLSAADELGLSLLRKPFRLDALGNALAIALRNASKSVQAITA